MTSLVTTKAYNFIQPSLIVTSKMCPNAVLRNVSIFLIVLTVIPSIVIPIISVTLLRCIAQLVRCPTGLGSVFIFSMPKLLTVVAIPIDTWCSKDL